MSETITWTRREDGRGFMGQPGDYILHPRRYDMGDTRGWPVEIGAVRSISGAKAIAEQHARGAVIREFVDNQRRGQ